MSNKTKSDWSTFTDPLMGIDLFGKAIRKANSYDSFAGKTVFKARAITDMWALTANQLMAIDGGATGDESGNNTRYAFKARIIGDNSPHSFLPDVCDPAYAGDEESTYRLISMHTTFISSKISETDSVTRGDIVTVELTKTGQTYNLEYGRFLGLSSQEDPTDREGGVCYSLKDLMGSWELNNPPDQLRRGFSGGNRSYDSLLDFISSGEGGYNAMNQGTVGNRIVGSTQDASIYLGKNLTEMTIEEVIEAQSSTPRRLFAAGRYQIIPKTMIQVVAMSGLSKGELFSKQNQDLLGKTLIYGRPKLAAYLGGSSNDIVAAQLDFAKEWASIPSPGPCENGTNRCRGTSFYGSGNKALHSEAEVRQALEDERARNLGEDVAT